MKTYSGIRKDTEALVLVANMRGVKGDLPMRQDLRNHSPTGFEWGYGGSGPAQLALAILADHFGPGGEQRALALYQEFKMRVIARLPYRGAWAITTREVEENVAAIERDRQPAMNNERAYTLNALLRDVQALRAGGQERVSAVAIVNGAPVRFDLLAVNTGGENGAELVIELERRTIVERKR
jgi:hypothetical protein